MHRLRPTCDLVERRAGDVRAVGSRAAGRCTAIAGVRSRGIRSPRSLSEARSGSFRSREQEELATLPGWCHAEQVLHVSRPTCLVVGSRLVVACEVHGFAVGAVARYEVGDAPT